LYVSRNSSRDEKSYALGPAGAVYRTTAEELTNCNDGRWWKAHLYRSTDGGRTWSEIPLVLSGRSLLARLLTHWPPQTIDQVEMSAGELSFLFHDREDTYEKAPLPLRRLDESLWRARSLTNGRWRVEQIRQLDFEGEDQHFRWEDWEHPS
jgi:hypothetical protein